MVRKAYPQNETPTDNGGGTPGEEPTQNDIECPERVENPNCFGWIEMCDPYSPCDGGEPDPGTGEPMPRGNEHGNHGGGYGCMPYPYPPCYPPYYPPYPPHGHHGHHPRYPMKGNIWMRCECACPPPVQTEDRFHIFPAGVQQEDIQTQASAFIALNPGARFGSLVDLEHDGWLLHYTVPV